MRIEINPERCISAGQCVMSAPEVFDQNPDDGIAFVANEPGAQHHQAVRDAAGLCPTAAITVVE